jgi:hypothetical protein
MRVKLCGHVTAEHPDSVDVCVRPKGHPGKHVAGWRFPREVLTRTYVKIDVTADEAAS